MKFNKKILAILLLIFSGVSSAQDLSGIATGVTKQLEDVAILLTYVAYIAGIAFVMIGVIQFKAHKDNPTQVPLSKPIVYLTVGACLLFLPTLMAAAGTTVFQEEKSTGVDFDPGSL
jgi:hypothetical protein